MSDILIVGGGVAGTATALALHQAGYTVRLTEAHEQGGADQGAFLTLMPNGANALAAIDAADAVAAAGCPAWKVHVYNAETGEATQHPAGAGHGLTTITRAALYAALHTLAHQRGITVEHGKRYRRSELYRDGVRVEFDNGSTVEAPLLIGADGIWSTVRADLDADNPEPSRAGLLVVYGAAPQTPDLAPEEYRFIRGSADKAAPPYTFGYTTDPRDGTTWWFLRIALDDAHLDLANPTQQEWKREALRVVNGDDTAAKQIVEHTPTVLGVDVHHLPSLSTWHTHTGVLAGDAAHAASPASAQGASLAAEDAVILAKCLRDLGGDPYRAFQKYEELRRERTEGIISLGAEQGQGKRKTAPVQPYEYRIDWQQKIMP